jgi:hypothetical protein
MNMTILNQVVVFEAVRDDANRWRPLLRATGRTVTGMAVSGGLGAKGYHDKTTGVYTVR